MLIDKSLEKELFTYLGSRPWAEVNGLITRLISAKARSAAEAGDSKPSEKQEDQA